MIFNNKTLLSIGHDHIQNKLLNSFNYDEAIIYDYKSFKINLNYISKNNNISKEYKFYNSKIFFFKVLFFILINPFRISLLSLKILKTKKYKYFCTGSYSILIFTILFSKIFRLKIKFIYIYADWFLSYQNKKNFFFYFFNTKIFKIIEYLIYKNTNNLIFYSDGILNNYKNYYLKKNNINKNYICLNFVDHLSYKNYRKINNIKPDLDIIKFFFIGNLRDDVDLIKFIKYLDNSKLYNFTVDIVGSGELKEELNDLRFQLNQNNNIFIHDFIHDFRIISEIAENCHFGLALNKYLSHSSYTFSGKINTYFNHKLPIIYSSNLIYVKKYINIFKLGIEFNCDKDVDVFLKDILNVYNLLVQNISSLNSKINDKIDSKFIKL